jgi:aspartate aminotransferase-like enzyme
MRRRLFLPGPVEVPEFIREAMSRPVIGHRTPEFRSLAKDVYAGLRTLLGTDRPVAVVPFTGTGVMEGAVRTLVGKRILHVSNGEFAKRWLSISVKNDLDAEMMFVPRGRVAGGGDVLRSLDELADIDTVAITHSETSTGVLAPLGDIGAAVSGQNDVLLLADTISSLGALDIRPEELGVDLVFASSQKAFGLPPGASIVWMSERAYRRAKDREAGGGYYLDLARWIDAAAEDSVASTPPIAHFFGLKASLDAILAEGIGEREARHRRIAARFREWGARFGSFPEAGSETPAVSVFRKPADFDFDGFRESLREKGYEIGDGYGRLRPKTFRIGHMGYVTDEDADGLISAMDSLL